MKTYAFIDGAYVREVAKSASEQPYNPLYLARHIIHGQTVGGEFAALMRVFYFDAERDDDSINSLEGYWRAIEKLDDTHLAFGWIRGKQQRRGPRQKAVDTLLAVNMLEGAYTRQFDVALLVAGDADYVPVVHAVRRAGPHVIVAAASDPSGQSKFAYSDELRSAADRFIELPPKPDIDPPSTPEHKRFTSSFKPLQPVCS